MARSTTEQLISRAKSMNEYDNHGVASDLIWIDHFNSALNDMVDVLRLDETVDVNFIAGTEEYTLPDDFYELIIVNDGNGRRVAKLRHYDQDYPPGYWVLNKGANWTLALKGYSSPDTFQVYYNRYPAVLTDADKSTQKPEVPTLAEDALVYKAITKALYNNNQTGRAQYFEELFKQEIAKINTANSRARG